MLMSSAGRMKLASERSYSFLACANNLISRRQEFWFLGFSGVEPYAVIC
jgi:hypothetical protein